MSMPKLPVEKMASKMGDEAIFILGAFNGGKLRASKPFPHIEGNDVEKLYKACVNYVWRMLCFDFVDEKPHNCMPYCATWDIDQFFYQKEGMGEITKGEEREQRKKTIEFLDSLIKKAESEISIFKQRGTCRWLSTGIVG